LSAGQLSRGTGRHLGACVEDVAQAGHGDAGLLEVGPQLGHAHDGLRHALGEHVEGDELADGHVVVHDQVRAVPEGGGVDELADEVDALVRPTGKVLGSEAGADIGGQLVVPAAPEGGLQRGGLDGLDGADGLHQHGLVLGAARELLVQAARRTGTTARLRPKYSGMLTSTIR
jgi:hypothetical protein